MWCKRCVLPDVTVGHSLGEVSAAGIAGGLSRKQCFYLSTKYGRLLDEVVSRDEVAYAVQVPEMEVVRSTCIPGI